MATVFTMRPSSNVAYIRKTRANVRVQMDNSRTAQDFEHLMRTTVSMRDEDKCGACVHCGYSFERSYVGEQVCSRCR